MATPICLSSARSKEQAVAQAAGKQVAGTLSPRPRWSLGPCCLRSPWGPSDTITLGTPRRSTPLSRQKSRPVSREAFSSVSCP